MMLNEAVAVTRTPTEISPNTRKTLGLFQMVLKIVARYYESEGDRASRITSLAKFKEFKKQINQYKHVPYVTPIFRQINAVNQKIIAKRQAKRQSSRQNVDQLLSRAVAAFYAGDVSSIIAHGRNLSHYVKFKSIGSDDEIIKAESKNPFYVENSWFFGSSGLLDLFTDQDIKRMSELDLSEYKYSYMPFPATKLDNFQFIAYYMLELKNSKMPVTVNGSKVKNYLDMAHSGNEYEELISMVKNYLSNNNKKLIPSILDLVDIFPEIVSLNDTAKETISRVYRGISGEPSEKIIIQTEKDQRVVATSTSFSTAENFAWNRGHLDSKSVKRSDHAAVIEYEVGPDSILLDTTIFGGIYGEEEVLIDATKAKITNIEWLSPDEDDDY